MTDPAPLTLEEKLEHVYAWVRTQERLTRRHQLWVRFKRFLTIALLIIVFGGGWYFVTHVDDMIRNLADRIAVSISDRVESSLTSVGDRLQEGAGAAAEGGSSLLERVRGYFQ